MPRFRGLQRILYNKIKYINLSSYAKA
ncbi:hypothetical protein KL86PLE_90289 [uncultured Pleomorphomonas sp.]|uniref:Uncharacterized protein n=1 Tax=uncultured Pleomorphomonas sp. TaxID=442121 RepID=A0A212LNU1_9HYPH|nr:hypothetical protein KL86PLE_90289 [uncultured Pleomorphomonas sp.]